MLAHEQLLWGAAGLFSASSAVTRDEWRATQPREPGPVARLLSRLRAG